ncbi:MAG: inositol monophosphatase [Actinomycetota bacterium]|nr:inositol monophosphatase [Actinomycetota bacterium]
MSLAEQLLELALGVAREAGELALRLRGEGVEVAGTKSSAVDIVTRADRASEELIHERLLGVRPDDGFLGEEGTERVGTTRVRWLVDPIDGTVNYLYGLASWSVSIAAEVDGVVRAGVVFAPASGEQYAATLGGGATLDGRTLRVREAASLAQSLVLTGFSYATEIRERQGAAVARMLPRVRDIRRLGSCALDLCTVASGRADAYVEEGINPWDYSAGGLVATEAGARVEVGTGASAAPLLVCAPEASFAAFRALVADCGL